MTPKDKDLVLKDLCGRLPYGVKAYVRNWANIDRKYYEGTYTVMSTFPLLNEIHVQSEIGSVDVVLGYNDYKIKPYLFPLSSMTEEQEREIVSITYSNHNDMVIASLTIDWLNKNHFDYRGLIEKGLALDATGKNIY